MRLETKKYLFDIQKAGRLVTEFIAGRDFADYTRDPLLRSAVERQLEIVGEALSKLAKTDPETVAKVTEHGRIIAFRNILIHGYAEVDNRVVWGVLEAKLPTLLREVGALLTDEN